MRTCVVEVEVEENKFVSTRQYEFSVKCYFVFKLLYKRERDSSPFRVGDVDLINIPSALHLAPVSDKLFLHI